MNLKTVIIGTHDYRAVLLAACAEGLQRQAGYVAPVMDTVQREFTFLHTSSGKVGFSIRECTVFRLDPNFWIEVQFPIGSYDDMKLRYPNVLVFKDFVVFCWSDAMEISYEWCQLEVTRECLIELWEAKQP
jgi:hypothetical protein